MNGPWRRVFSVIRRSGNATKAAVTLQSQELLRALLPRHTDKQLQTTNSAGCICSPHSLLTSPLC